MSDTYRIFGGTLSPYSMKTWAYFKYKNIPHEWTVRNQSNMAEFQKYAKLPLIPLVVTPDDTGMQDSTPILEKMEKKFPEPSLHPADPTLRFLSELLEEYGDEWGNKPMFHYRWWREVDQHSAARRIAEDNMPGVNEQGLEQMTKMLIGRMVPRLKFVGSSEETKELIENSFTNQIRILNAHLGTRPYLFGKRPAFADFGVAPQLYQLWSDPTPHDIIERDAPHVAAYAQRMNDPENAGDFESWDTLKPTLTPLLTEEVGAIFLPWSTANAKALAAGEKRFTVQLPGGTFTQDTQKYHAKSLGVIREKYQAVTDKSALDAILEETGCLKWLA